MMFYLSMGVTKARISGEVGSVDFVMVVVDVHLLEDLPGVIHQLQVIHVGICMNTLLLLLLLGQPLRLL
jgi:hypothetical protein